MNKITPKQSVPMTPKGTNKGSPKKVPIFFPEQQKSRTISKKEAQSSSYRLSTVPNKFASNRAVENEKYVAFTDVYFSENPQELTDETTDEKREAIKSQLEDENLESSEKIKLLTQLRCLEVIDYGESSPEYGKVLFEMGREYHKDGRGSSAIRNLRKAKKVDDESRESFLTHDDIFEYHLLITESYYMEAQKVKSKPLEFKKNIKAAASSIENIIEHDHSDPVMMYRKNHTIPQINSAKGNHEDAIPQFDQVIDECKSVYGEESTPELGLIYREAAENVEAIENKELEEIKKIRKEINTNKANVKMAEDKLESAKNKAADGKMIDKRQADRLRANLREATDNLRRVELEADENIDELNREEASHRTAMTRAQRMRFDYYQLAFDVYCDLEDQEMAEKIKPKLATEEERRRREEEEELERSTAANTVPQSPATPATPTATEGNSEVYMTEAEAKSEARAPSISLGKESDSKARALLEEEEKPKEESPPTSAGELNKSEPSSARSSKSSSSKSSKSSSSSNSSKSSKSSKASSDSSKSSKSESSNSSKSKPSKSDSDSDNSDSEGGKSTASEKSEQEKESKTSESEKEDNLSNKSDDSDDKSDKSDDSDESDFSHDSDNSFESTEKVSKNNYDSDDSKFSNSFETTEKKTTSSDDDDDFMDDDF